ncbi:MAG: endonuclease III domain-containing protein [Thermodesulfobacteriota bacterium]
MKPSGLKETKAQIERIDTLLERQYGIPKKGKKSDPLRVLVQTILSQNTNDRNRDWAYQRLKNQFPRWEEMLKGDRRAIEEALRPGGLARQKAKRIVDILQWLKKRQGKVSLAFLKRMDSEEVKETLSGLKGIGPKTVHCLLLFGLGREAFPVDTHILRVGKRLGFIPERLDAVKAHSWMAPLVPKGKAFSLHLNLIKHGRSVCNAKKPQCKECVLKNECFHFKVIGRPSMSAHRSVPGYAGVAA